MSLASIKVSADYSLAGQYINLNKFILSQAKDKLFKNYIYFFTESSRPKVSITCRFDEQSTEYYGLHPQVTASIIRENILKSNIDGASIFSNEYNLFHYIDNSEIWSVPSEDKYALLNRAFCAKCLLTMASYFYFDLDLSRIENTVDHFLRIINDDTESKDDRFEFSFISISPDEQKKEKNKRLHRLHGRLPQIILEKLDKCGYSFYFEDHHVVVNKDAEKLSKFSLLYDEKNAGHLLCTSSAFYSGVNLRLKKVEIDSNSSSNNQMSSLILTVEKTTFGTICGFDGFFRGKVCQDNKINIIRHPYLKNYFTELYRIIDDEIVSISDNIPFVFSALSEQSFQSVPCPEKSIEDLNNYLDQSIYPHYINVSGNVITNDNYCLYTSRGKATTDAETLYCSVNGVSEVFDPYVEFYLRSVDEDSPTIKYPSTGNRIDFNGELSRESEAELGTSNFSSNWKYYGFSMMGYYDQKRETIDACHFNIAAFNHVNSSFFDIVNFRENATEKFENNCLYGYQLKVYTNLRDGVFGFIKMMSQWILVWKDVVLFLLLFISSMIISRNIVLNDIATIINTILSTLFSCCLIYVSAAKLYSQRRLINVGVVLSKFPLTDSKEYIKIIKKCLRKGVGKKEKNSSHVILMLMSALYFLSEATVKDNKRIAKK